MAWGGGRYQQLMMAERDLVLVSKEKLFPNITDGANFTIISKHHQSPKHKLTNAVHIFLKYIRFVHSIFT